MSVNSYEELLALVEERRQDTLTIAVDMGGEYSSEHEEAKQALQASKALRTLTGEDQFLSTSGLDSLQRQVDETRPPSVQIYIRFKKIPLSMWTALMSKNQTNALQQFHEILPETFLGIWGDPDAENPLTSDWTSVDPMNDKCILPGGSIVQIIQTFMNWQNSGSDVTVFQPR